MKTITNFGAKIGGSRADRAAAIKAAPPEAAGAATATPPRPRKPKGPMRFNLYRDRMTGEFYVCKAGDKAHRRLLTFASADRDRAMRFRLDYTQAALEARWAEVRESSNVTDDCLRRDANTPRVGLDHRAGVSMTPESFLATFAPYGVEFGLWQDRRQDALNRATDALLDLATVVRFQPRALTFHGRLALAFGARGSGRFAAHYECGRRVINLTKTQGAGSLAHEWFHAFDHASTVAAGGYGFTGSPALVTLWLVLQTLPVYTRSRAADATRSKPYYGTAEEVCARCFEAWVRSLVTNDYLANIRTVEEFAATGRDRGTYPYPLPEEMPAVGAAFRRLFGVV